MKTEQSYFRQNVGFCPEFQTDRIVNDFKSGEIVCMGCGYVVERGVPKDFFTSFFVASKIAGWTAHMLEQYADSLLIRPTSEYIGEYERKYIPIEKRTS